MPKHLLLFNYTFHVTVIVRRFGNFIITNVTTVTNFTYF